MYELTNVGREALSVDPHMTPPPEQGTLATLIYLVLINL
jgi:hypothetical protein